MRTTIALFTLCFMLSASAQDEASNNEAFVRNMDQALNTFNTNNVGGTAFRFRNPKREIKGSIYLFDNWDSRAVLVTTKGQKYRVGSVNINLKNQTFESRFHKDSLFTFSFSELDRFVINNKPYKNFYYDEDNRIYELIYESDDFSILKGHRLEMVEGSANPMLNRKDDKYVKKDNYYLLADKAIKPFKLKKKRILKLVAKDQIIVEEVEKYVKANQLSYKDENDINKILDYATRN